MGWGVGGEVAAHANASTDRCPARRGSLRALTGVRAVWAPMRHSRVWAFWSGVRRAAACGGEARVAAKTAGAGAGAPTAAEWDDRAEHDITILLFWCLVAHGHLRRYALARTQPGERRRLDEQQLAADAFYTAVAFQTDMRQTDTDRFLRGVQTVDSSWCVRCSPHGSPPVARDPSHWRRESAWPPFSRLSQPRWHGPSRGLAPKADGANKWWVRWRGASASSEVPLRR